MLGHVKFAGVVGVVAAVGLGYWHYTSLVSELSAARVTIATQTAALEAKDIEIKFLEQQQKNLKRRNDELYKNLRHATEGVDRVRTLFANHDFYSLMERNPSLITLRAKKATKKLFNQIEELSVK